MESPSREVTDRESIHAAGAPAMQRSAELRAAGGGEDAPMQPGAVDAERELLARLRAGDDKAFEHLVRSHSPRLLAVARRLCQSAADADDALQEAFLAAFRAIDRFDGRSTVGTWLHRIVVNAALARSRRIRTESSSSIEALLPHFEGGRHARSPSPWRPVDPDRVIDVELRDAVREAIQRLPDDFRTVIVLKDVEGMSSAEIATALGISDHLVRQRVHRGRQALIRLLTPVLQEDMR